MRKALAVCAIALAIAPRLHAQSVQKMADSVLALNRTGHWANAEHLAANTLKRTSPRTEMVARCQLTEGMAYSRMRLQNPAGASAALRIYEQACAKTPELRAGLSREAAQLRKEIDSALAPRKG